MGIGGQGRKMARYLELLLWRIGSGMSPPSVTFVMVVVLVLLCFVWGVGSCYVAQVDLELCDSGLSSLPASSLVLGLQAQAPHSDESSHGYDALCFPGALPMFVLVLLLIPQISHLQCHFASLLPLP